MKAAEKVLSLFLLFLSVPPSLSLSFSLSLAPSSSSSPLLLCLSSPSRGRLYPCAVLVGLSSGGAAGLPERPESGPRSAPRHDQVPLEARDTGRVPRDRATVLVRRATARASEALGSEALFYHHLLHLFLLLFLFVSLLRLPLPTLERDPGTPVHSVVPCLPPGYTLYHLLLLLLPLPLLLRLVDPERV